MIPAKIEPISITPISEKSLESIVNWFNQRKQSFYILGWSYLGNQRQMEELFYRSIIKVQKELPRFKRETSFEIWVTSIFIHICRELSVNGSLQHLETSEPRQDLFKALDQLEEYEKEAVVLKYIIGIPLESAAGILRITENKLKEHLLSAVQSLKKGMGFELSLNGCKEYHKNYIDYLERKMDRPEKVEFEIHIYHCQNCQEDLAAFQDTILTLPKKTEDFHVPANFLESLKAKLVESEKQRQLKNRKRFRIGIVFASVFSLFISIEVITGAFTNAYYSYAEEDQQLRAFLQQDLGKVLNLVAESEGVKITIKSVVADDVQTLVFYEIEDTDEDDQYFMMYQDGVIVENEHEIMNRAAYPRHYFPHLESNENKREKNVFRGKMSLLPLGKDKGTIELKITKLYKLIRASDDRENYIPYENLSFETGEWNFEIPVTKKPSTEYALDEETEIEGIPVRFDKLTIAPTATILEYAIPFSGSGKRIDALNFGNLKVNNKKLKADRYGNNFGNGINEWMTYHMHFDPLYGEKPIEANVWIESANLTVEDKRTIELNASEKYPQTFEYAGSTISIDRVEAGDSTNVVISNHAIKNRAFESLHFEIFGEDGNTPMEMEMMNPKGVFVDKKGIEYDPNEITFVYEKLEQPRYFFTEENIMFRSKNEGDNIPKILEIYSYTTTKFLNEMVKISLE
ncbi:DUF4179 domain-containing protein [Bacillus sp. EB01]|uniref:DUF4179 domain-containing protein n=1 Tax=Bacillus sp. EB01 TaxID=1347086 RepID=UPI0005C5AA01|nr:DUF4179 domain-containing protein [Bacillus sp. EB01]